MDDPQRFPNLFHPELRDKSWTYCVLRSNMLSRWWYPASEQISWYGGMRRTFPGGDGGNGMWMTESLAEAWKDRTDDNGIKIGPS